MGAPAAGDGRNNPSDSDSDWREKQRREDRNDNLFFGAIYTIIVGGFIYLFFFSGAPFGPIPDEVLIPVIVTF